MNRKKIEQAVRILTKELESETLPKLEYINTQLTREVTALIKPKFDAIERALLAGGAWLHPSVAAIALEVGVDDLTRLKDEGLPHVRFGQSERYLAEDLMEFVDEERVEILKQLMVELER